MQSSTELSLFYCQIDLNFEPWPVNIPYNYNFW
jgi:hypothetical protein